MTLVEKTFEINAEGVIVSNNGSVGTSTTWFKNGTKSLEVFFNQNASWLVDCCILSPNFAANDSVRSRFYMKIPTAAFPVSGQIRSFLNTYPWSVNACWLYSDGSLWMGYADAISQVAGKNYMGTPFTELLPAGSIPSNEPFRLEFINNSTSPSEQTRSRIAVFKGANLNSTTPSVEYKFPINSGQLVNFDGTYSITAFGPLTNSSTGGGVASTVYIDDVAYENRATGSGGFTSYLGPSSVPGFPGTEIDFESGIPATILDNPPAVRALSTVQKRSGSNSLKVNNSSVNTYAFMMISETGPATFRGRMYVRVPTNCMPTGTQLISLFAAAPYYTTGFHIYPDGSLWYGYADSSSVFANKTGFTQVAPAGSIVADEWFRLEVVMDGKNLGGVGKAAFFKGANLETTTPTTSVTNLPAYATGYHNYGSTSLTPTMVMPRFDGANFMSVATNSDIYIDDVAYEFTTVTDYIGPAAAPPPSGTVTASATLMTTATLTTNGFATKNVGAMSIISTHTLSASGQVIFSPADVTLPIWNWFVATPSGALSANIGFSTTFSLTIGSTTLIKRDISELIVGADGTYGIGYIEIPQSRVDDLVTITVSTANCQGLNTAGLEVILPKPLTPNVDHAVTVEYKMRDYPRRVYLSLNRPYNNGSTRSGSGFVLEKYGRVRCDGFVVEPGPAANTESIMVYRWSAADQMWWIDTWSGTVNLIDHRPNEMPEDMGPCYFSPQIRAHAQFAGIKEEHVNALKALPYWVNRFMKENHFVSDIVSWTDGPQGHGSLIWEGLGTREQLNPASFASANGTSIVPVSMAKAWSRSILSPTEIDGRVILHELGHLFDYFGLRHAGHYNGYDPEMEYLLTDLYATVDSYYDAPTNSVLQEHQEWTPEYIYSTYYAPDGVTVTGYNTYVRWRSELTGEAPVVAMYNHPAVVSAKNAGNYYASQINEWVAQMLCIYFMRLNPNYYNDPNNAGYYDGTPQGTEQNYNNFVSYMIEVGVLPSLQAMVNYATLTVNGTVVKNASAPTISTTATLSAEAAVRVREKLSGWGIVSSGFTS